MSIKPITMDDLKESYSHGFEAAKALYHLDIALPESGQSAKASYVAATLFLARDKSPDEMRTTIDEVIQLLGKLYP